MIKKNEIKEMGTKYSFRGNVVYVYLRLVCGRGARLFLAIAHPDKKEITYNDILSGSVKQSEFMNEAEIA